MKFTSIVCFFINKDRTPICLKKIRIIRNTFIGLNFYIQQEQMFMFLNGFLLYVIKFHSSLLRERPRNIVLGNFFFSHVTRINNGNLFFFFCVHNAQRKQKGGKAQKNTYCNDIKFPSNLFHITMDKK